MTDLSIIIVNRNGAGYLESCLQAVYAATRKIGFEIIFIDNGSTDNSLEIVKTKFPDVRIIKNDRNFGFSRANNQGLKIYQGRYALLLNTDTVVKERALEQMVEFMDTHPKVGACGPKLMNTDGTPQHQGSLFARKFWLSKVPVKVDCVIGACLLARREAIDKVGGLDENFYFSNEDLDWCRRIRKAGWNIYFLPQAEVVHYGGFTTKRFNEKLYLEGFRGGLYFGKKHYGNIAYQTYRLLLGLALMIMIPFAFIFKRQKLKAYGEILRICVKGEITP